MQIFLTSIIAFISTNIDDIFLLILFYASRKMKGADILMGQTLGIAALVCLSLAGSLLGLIVNPAYIGLLGLVPIYLGIRNAIGLMKSKADDGDELPKSGSNAILTVAGVTIANGGDNIGVYVPLFATMSWAEKVIMVFVFMVMTVVWCAGARYLVSHPYIAVRLDKIGHLVMPIVLILLGVYILYESNAVSLVIR
jgi:cadmium resistance transport/sequestration family protein